MVHSAVQPLSSGQIVVFAVPRADSIAIDVLGAVEIIKNSIQKYGRLFAFVRLSTFPDGSFRAVAEYCNATSASAAVTAVANSPMVEVRDSGPQVTMATNLDCIRRISI